jgi:lipoprotein-anchoring transpeptidase ErfK/SrfK
MMRRKTRSCPSPCWLNLVTIALLLAAVLLGGTSSPGSIAQARTANILPGTTVYFPRTGQTAAGPFLAYWLEHPEVGMPISSHIRHGLHLTQWFEFARLELRGVPFEQAGAQNVFRVELGWVYANRVGYARKLDAFAPKPAGPDRFFPETGHSLQNGFRHMFEQWGMPERLGPPISDEFIINGVTYQYFQFGAFSWEPSQGVRLVPLGMLDAGLNGHLDAPQPMPPGAINADAIDALTLAGMLAGERWIEINLSTYTLTAWVGDWPVLTSTVVVGSRQAPTVVGTFAIYLKYESQNLSGISWTGARYYEPGVPWVMYFYQDYAIHGSTWRTTFGYPDGEGCVIPPNEVARQLFQFAGYGTRVWVHY